ncbi:eglS [Symbiodinium microadriaticum]|nr:eglS [Symbiodinium microadriaticum]
MPTRAETAVGIQSVVPESASHKLDNAVEDKWGGKYWNEDTLRWLQRDWGIQIIRAAMGVEAGGYLDRPEREFRKLVRVVWAAHALGLYVIVDWHDHHANRNIARAKPFFRRIAKTYGHLPNVLFETFNEPTWQSWSQAVKPYHQEILKVIRPYSDNIVICGTPTWSQDVDIASNERVQGDNIVYTLHFYAGTHHQYLRDKAIKAVEMGVALLVSEWGTCEANGNGHLDLEEAQKWEDLMAEYNITDANWAVNDKKESCSALQPGAATNGHWGAADLTPSGRWVRASLRHHAFGILPPWLTTTEAPSGNSSEQNDTQISSSTAPASEGVRRLRGSLHALFDLPLSVRLRHLETKHSFEFIVERRSHAVLLSSPLAPFERVALPSVLPETGVGPDILDLNVARASGNDKDWPLFWCVSSWDSDGSLCLEISSARRPDLVLSASLEGQLVLQRRPSSHLGRTASSTFIEVFCQEHLHIAAATSSTVSATPLCRSESEEVQSLAPSRSLLPEDLRSFARNGYVVVKQAVPDFLWRPACALVHSEIGSQGMIQGGDTSNSGFESVGKLQGKTPHRPQFRDLLLHPSSAAGSCAAQMLGWRSISAVLKGRQLPAQVALRFPDAILAEEKARSWAAPLQLDDLLWHTDGCSTRQCSRHPFSLLVGERLLITAKAPQVVRDLPAALRVQETLQFDQCNYNLREQISSLLVGADVGHFPNERKALEDFEAIPSIFRSFPARQRLCEVLTEASDFLAVYERLVLEVLVPWLRQRLEKQVGSLGPTNFSYQYPPTLRIQPGRSEEFKRPHRDAEYGHQIGELNFWMPLTDYNMTQATLWVESSPGAEDFQPLAINHGSIAVFHGTLCRHKVPANTSPFTRVSLDFRIGIGDFFDRLAAGWCEACSQSKRGCPVTLMQTELLSSWLVPCSSRLGRRETPRLRSILEAAPGKPRLCGHSSSEKRDEAGISTTAIRHLSSPWQTSLPRISRMAWAKAVTGRHTRPSPHCGKASVWPGSHAHLRREPALKICDAGSDAAALCREGAALRGYEGLMPCPPDAKAPGQALPLDLRAGDCVMLHPHTAHAAAPRYTPSGIRIMVYFRLRATPAMARPEPDDEASESCRQVFFDLPGVASALGESRWSDFLRAADSRALLQQQEHNRNLEAQVRKLVERDISARVQPSDCLPSDKCLPSSVFGRRFN